MTGLKGFDGYGKPLLRAGEEPPQEPTVSNAKAEAKVLAFRPRRDTINIGAPRMLQAA